jgi:cyclophilin family peptidyl-prolyl cis-trans isomerase
MSATPPSTLEGTEAPNPFEVLWERYRSLILTVITAVLLALVGNSLWTYMQKEAVSENWSQFSASLGMEAFYADPEAGVYSMPDALEKLEMADLEKGLAEASEAQKPYLHLAIARKAMLESDWDRATSALAAIESGYPKHDLLAVTKRAVQSRDPKKVEDGEETPTEPQWEDGAEGSVVSLMKKQIEDAKNFQLPVSFQKPEIPADAKKVKFTFGDYGSFTMALMPSAPKHAQALLDLVTKDDGAWWKGIAVDEIHRSTKGGKQPYSLHFGLETSKDDDRTKWSATEPSTHQVEWEDTGLSHFAGAVAASPEAEGMSCCDRLWISVDDEASMDGNRVVFAYVVEGLDVLRAICEAGLDIQDEERGQGRPTENIRITAVEAL